MPVSSELLPDQHLATCCGLHRGHPELRAASAATAGLVIRLESDDEAEQQKAYS
jgi:hypothetical protein